MTLLLDLFALLIVACAMPVALLGLFIVFHVARPQRSPADTSNRINKVRLIWFALTREELFAEVFPWLKRDELKNVTKDGNA